jgi:hypothetical protein
VDQVSLSAAEWTYGRSEGLILRLIHYSIYSTIETLVGQMNNFSRFACCNSVRIHSLLFVIFHLLCAFIIFLELFFSYCLPSCGWNNFNKWLLLLLLLLLLLFTRLLVFVVAFYVVSFVYVFTYFYVVFTCCHFYTWPFCFITSTVINENSTELIELLKIDVRNKLTEPCALGSTQTLKMSTRDFSWGKGGRCVTLTTCHPRSAERQENPGP